MPGVRAATVLALWGAAYRCGAASPDEVLEQLAGAGRSAGVRAADSATADRVGLPGPGEANTGSIALLELLRRGGTPRLVLPVAGDVRGLPPSSPALLPALDAGAAVVLPSQRIAVSPSEGHWRVFGVLKDASNPLPAAPEPPKLFDAERDLDAAIRAATAQLVRLDVARGADGVREKIAHEMRQAAITVPSGWSRAQRHGARLLAKVVSLEALLQVAAAHDTAAVTRHQLASMDDALRPLAAAVRFGRLAAVAELVDDLTLACRPAADQAADRRWAVAERDHGDRQN